MTEYTNNISRETEVTPTQHEWGGSRRKQILIGLFVIGIGKLLLLRQLGVDFPDWLFSWPMILIAFGIIGAIKHRFRPGSWILAIAVGGVFLVERLTPGLRIQQYAWPVLVIAAGLWLVFRPKRYRGQADTFSGFSGRRGYRRGLSSVISDTDNASANSTAGPTSFTPDGNDQLDVTSIFSGINKIILSKNFRGGEIVNIMGGSEINLSQADITGRVTIDTTNIFGGTKLVVPSTWDVQSDVVAIFGGVDDKRSLYPENRHPEKVVLLTGVCIFGGIEIRSY